MIIRPVQNFAIWSMTTLIIQSLQNSVIGSIKNLIVQSLQHFVIGSMMNFDYSISASIDISSVGDFKLRKVQAIT